MDPRGLEQWALRLLALRSNQLSYETVTHAVDHYCAAMLAEGGRVIGERGSSTRPQEYVTYAPSIVIFATPLAAPLFHQPTPGTAQHRPAFCYPDRHDAGHARFHFPHAFHPLLLPTISTTASDHLGKVRMS
jgi:hypothetical protein